MKWSTASEELVSSLRLAGKTYAEIGGVVGVSATSVKHKVRRLQQDNNEDRYKHTKEKIEQTRRYVPLKYLNKVLETHAGFGGLTEFYSEHASSVTSLELKKDRVDFINELGLKNVTTIQCDSETKIHFLVYKKEAFTYVDVDPYGLPSRYFPHVFSLIDDGYLALTFPVLGVAQINKITIAHYKNFWDFEILEKDRYLEKISEGLRRYAFMAKRSIDIVSVEKINRIYRLVIAVKKESMLDIVGLKVNRNKAV